MTTLVLLAGWMAVSGCSTGSLNPKADKNLDGGVSFTEFDAYMKESIFTEFDANGDGVVTMAEWRQMDPKGPASKFTKADANGDGRVTRAESDARMDRDGSMKKLFKKVDTDGQREPQQGGDRRLPSPDEPAVQGHGTGETQTSR